MKLEILKKSKKFSLSVFTVVCIFSTIVCSSKDSASSESRLTGILANLFSAFDSKPTLKNISENFISYQYKELDQTVKSLKDQITNLPDACGGNTVLLDNLQSTYKTSYRLLKRIEIIQFGASGSYSTIDSWPLNYLLNPPDTVKITATISGTETISETNLSSKSDNENGFPAIEYLLFDNGSGVNTNSAICLSLSGRRKTYLQEATNLLYTRVARISFNWNPASSGNYSTILQNPGPTNEFYKSEKEVMDTLIKQIVTIVEKIKDDKVGYPAGLSADSGGVVRSNIVESRFARMSIENIQNNLEGLYSFYLGVNGPGISDYVRYYNQSLDDRIRAKILETIAKSKEISDLQAEILSNPARVKELSTKLNELKVIFTVELAGNLGSTFTPGVGDGDGD